MIHAVDELMAQEAANSGLSRQQLINTRWTFGFRGHVALTTTFGFGESGDIVGYQHENEASWRLKDGVLEIYRRSGELMWTSGRLFKRDDGRTCVILSTPSLPTVEFALSEYRPPLTVAEYLFPQDLHITPTNLKRVLLIGSCLTTAYHEAFSKQHPETTYDRIVFNIAGDLPDTPPAAFTDYDLQYVQIPLRSIIGDRIVWAARFNDPEFCDEIVRDGLNVIDAMLSAALQYNRTHGLLTLVCNFFVPQMSAAPSLRARGRPSDLAYVVRRFNGYLAEAVNRYDNAFLVDVNAVADSLGKRHVLDDMMFFYSHGAVQIQIEIDPTWESRIEPIPPIAEFYDLRPDEFIEAVYQQMVSTYRAARQIDQVKAVIFDLDHTLWRGQLAEHYRPDVTAWPAADGWPMGLWEAIHHLRARGILVAICSKNDFETVQRNWANAVRPEFISLQDFSSVKINWSPKAENIRAICEEFNIKPKSILFVDDNPVERASVKAALPEIRVLGSNPLLTRRILLWAAETQVATLTDESLRREDMIRRQKVREETRAVLSRDQFLATLGCVLIFSRIADSAHPDFGRALELINKTNQFNTTGRRWTHAEIGAFLEDGGVLLAFRVSDRFADYGLVGVLLIHGARIEQFVMSCRVLGMEIESAALAHAALLLRAEAANAICAPLAQTQDNAPCRGVYAKCGFTESERSTSDALYVLPPEAALRVPSHITIRS